MRVNKDDCVVLEQGIADELLCEEGEDYIIPIESEKELENLFLKIMNTKRIIEIIQKIVDATKVVGTTIEM